MLIIPAINCKNFNCVKERIKTAEEFLPRVRNKRWVQIDVSDGKFTKAKTWNDPRQLQNYLRLTTDDSDVKSELRQNRRSLRLNFEIHLMVENPEFWMKKWLNAGADRAIIHFEALKDLRFKIQDSRFRNKLGIAITPKTPVEIIVPFLQGRGSTRNGRRFTRIAQPEFGFDFVQLLAVNPGYSGQRFDLRRGGAGRNTLSKIKFLKKYYPKIIVEIDGGINPQTAKLVKKAGADIVNSGSYIFNSNDPKGAYKKLQV